MCTCVKTTFLFISVNFGTILWKITHISMWKKRNIIWFNVWCEKSSGPGDKNNLIPNSKMVGPYNNLQIVYKVNCKTWFRLNQVKYHHEKSVNTLIRRDASCFCFVFFSSASPFICVWWFSTTSIFLLPMAEVQTKW